MRVSSKKKFGVVTEGQGEVLALPTLYKQLSEAFQVCLLAPLHVNVDPRAPLPLLCRRVGDKVKLAQARGADTTLVLIDVEDSRVCPGQRAKAIEEMLVRSNVQDVVVIMKNSCFENWLISDRNAFSLQSSLFPRARLVNFPSGCADEVRAIDLIKSALSPRVSYSKTIHPKKILSQASMLEMAQNSRSFQKLVRTLQGL